jgi:hypothetical protein
MKFADLELEEPITRDRYQVQIKSKAGTAEFTAYRDHFSGQGFRKLFFVEHSPNPGLTQDQSNDFIEPILPDRLAAMIVNAGLASWVLTMIR